MRSPYERHLIQVLRDIGVKRPGVSEHAFLGARVGGTLNGRWIEVYSFTRPAARPPGPVLDSVRLAGRPLQIVRTQPYGEVARFRCGTVSYDVASMSRRFGIGTSDRAAATKSAEMLLDQLTCD
jgi:hypothetical protein